MSVTVDYFFNYGKSLAELARELNALIGCSLILLETDEPGEQPSKVYQGVFFAMELWLAKREFENDGERTCEDYEYRLSTRTRFGDADLRTMQIPATAFIA